MNAKTPPIIMMTITTAAASSIVPLFGVVEVTEEVGVVGVEAGVVETLEEEEGELVVEVEDGADVRLGDEVSCVFEVFVVPTDWDEDTGTSAARAVALGSMLQFRRSGGVGQLVQCAVLYAASSSG